ncbi:helix-turn-helix transcriptional regulator [Niallia alba]|uniref:helix-turn-helix domain-containing protein n=1 Tax=Niallia alba TaxID=2729105 RepID=UPI002E1B5A5E|nr:helix-turn-helix transcriptional regulator [Niallia alba]
MEAIDIMLKSHLKVKLAEKGISNNQLAEMLRVNKQTVSNWVSGRHVPPLETLFVICEKLECDINDLYTYIKE